MLLPEASAFLPKSVKLSINLGAFLLNLDLTLLELAVPQCSRALRIINHFDQLSIPPLRCFECGDSIITLLRCHRDNVLAIV